MLVSESPRVDAGGIPPDASPGSPAWSLDDRDPSGALRGEFPEIAGLSDHRPDVTELQEALYAALKRLAHPVSLTTLPGSSHDAIGLTGRPLFLAAFHEAAAEGGRRAVRSLGGSGARQRHLVASCRLRSPRRPFPRPGMRRGR
jgi:hypothetical protein